MIIDFSYDADTYHELLSHYGRWLYTCPVCNTVGEWQRHGTYLRYSLVNEDNEGNALGDRNLKKWLTNILIRITMRIVTKQRTF